MKKLPGLKKVLTFLGVAALLWVIYSICVSLLAIWIFWVYVGLFAAGAILYVILVRGNLTAPPELPPPGVEPASYAAYREEILALRKRYSFLPPIAVGALLCILLDYINLMWFGGMFL